MQMNTHQVSNSAQRAVEIHCVLLTKSCSLWLSAAAAGPGGSTSQSCKEAYNLGRSV